MRNPEHKTLLCERPDGTIHRVPAKDAIDNPQKLNGLRIIAIFDHQEKTLYKLQSSQAILILKLIENDDNHSTTKDDDLKRPREENTPHTRVVNESSLSASKRDAISKKDELRVKQRAAQMAHEAEKKETLKRETEVYIQKQHIKREKDKKTQQRKSDIDNQEYRRSQK